MQISQVMMSYTQPNFVQIRWKKYLSQSASEMFDTLQYDTTKCAFQYELNSCYHGNRLVSRPSLIKAFLAIPYSMYVR